MIWNPYTKEEIAAMERGLLTDEQRRAVEARLSAGASIGGPAGADLPDAKAAAVERDESGGSVAAMRRYWNLAPTALQWQPIKTAPRGKWVLVCGPNRAQPPVAFVTAAIYIGRRLLEPWRGLDYRPLSADGRVPLFWCPLPALPAMP